MSKDYWIAFIIISAGALFSWLNRKLTLEATITGVVLSGIIFWGTGLPGLSMIVVFSVLGIGATTWKLSVKKQAGVAEAQNGRRNTGQVLGNAGVAGLLAISAKLLNGDAGLLQLMLAAGFSAATADTLSSELGNLYGKRYIHLLSFQRMRRGDNGAVSPEGTLAGIAGSLTLSLIYVSLTGWSTRNMLIIVIAGTLGNMADSVLGLTLENRGLLTNNRVNLLNTAVGAITAWALNAVL
ncbi:MAG: DUF92 domain-containing protein [Chitinophagaceae bacterium]|nr:DUF92 domain-containing protein [Chitinophagaceae bacterium]